MARHNRMGGGRVHENKTRQQVQHTFQVGVRCRGEASPLVTFTVWGKKMPPASIEWRATYALERRIVMDSPLRANPTHTGHTASVHFVTRLRAWRTGWHLAGLQGSRTHGDGHGNYQHGCDKRKVVRRERGPIRGSHPASVSNARSPRRAVPSEIRNQTKTNPHGERCCNCSPFPASATKINLLIPSAAKKLEGLEKGHPWQKGDSSQRLSTLRPQKTSFFI